MNLQFHKIQFGLSITEPLVGMPKMAMALWSSRVAFHRLNHFPKFSISFIPTNLLSRKKTLRVLPLKIRPVGNARCRVICMNSGGKKMSSRLAQMNEVLQDSEERAADANEPIPKVSLEHVTVSFARSGGPGGQNVNKVNTKVDMRFNVAAAHWLTARVKERILQMEKNRINNDGELVISSTRTRTQKGNIEDALEKLQAIIDAASYVPPPPSEEKKQRIKKLSFALGTMLRSCINTLSLCLFFEGLPLKNKRD